MRPSTTPNLVDTGSTTVRVTMQSTQQQLSTVRVTTNQNPVNTVANKAPVTENEWTTTQVDTDGTTETTVPSNQQQTTVQISTKENPIDPGGIAVSTTPITQQELTTASTGTEDDLFDFDTTQQPQTTVQATTNKNHINTDGVTQQEWIKTQQTTVETTVLFSKQQVSTKQNLIDFVSTTPITQQESTTAQVTTQQPQTTAQATINDDTNRTPFTQRQPTTMQASEEPSTPHISFPNEVTTKESIRNTMPSLYEQSTKAVNRSKREVPGTTDDNSGKLPL